MTWACDVRAEVREIFLDAQFITIEHARGQRINQILADATQYGQWNEIRRARYASDPGYAEKRRAENAAYKRENNESRRARYASDPEYAAKERARIAAAKARRKAKCAR